MDRLVAAGNSGIKGVLDKGSAVATDPTTVTMNLVSANGNFPYLVSVFNAQSLITPADYVQGTLADKTPNGTGAWKIVEGSYDIASGVKFVRNDAWWGPKTPLDGTEFTFFDDTASMVTAYQGGQIDALVQFDVLSGAPLFNDANFTVVDTPTTNHRQIWMHTDSGTFADPKVRVPRRGNASLSIVTQSAYRYAAKNQTFCERVTMTSSAWVVCGPDHPHGVDGERQDPDHQHPDLGMGLEAEGVLVHIGPAT